MIKIFSDRVKELNNKHPQDGEYVLYWMQAAQRAHYNHALEFAIEQANEKNIPLLVFFGLTPSFPEGNARHYYFLLEGLAQVEEDLEDRGIEFIVWLSEPFEGVEKLGKNARMVITDRGYLSIEKTWRKKAAKALNCPLIEVETNTVVPVEVVSGKEEYAAFTLRKKMKPYLSSYLVEIKQRNLKKKSLNNFDLPSLSLSDKDKIIEDLKISTNPGRVESFEGGTKGALKCLETFLDNNLDVYSEKAGDPAFDCQSGLSPYLHFGQISPVYIALKTRERGSPGEEDFLEQLLIRRELSFNFVNFNPYYNGPLEKMLPEWAWNTLRAHSKDKRDYLYSPDELEKASTHDNYWNAAQREMVLSGKMHGYMRMYWGKKILEWSKTPDEAFSTCLYLNNRYNLDGRDPNSFAGVSWCFGKHDRAWTERNIFGKVRYMNDKGLERKFDMEKYLKRVREIGRS